MNKVKLQGNLIIGFVNILFAFNLIITKSLLHQGNEISPEGLTLGRILFACVAFWITSLFTKKEKVEKKDLYRLIFCGILGIAFNQALFLGGLNKSFPVDASILTTCTPMMVMILAFFILKEPITWKKAGGVIIGSVGVYLLIFSGDQDYAQVGGNLKGNLMILGSGLSYAIYLVIAKPLTLKYSAVTIMKWMYLFSAIFLFPIDYQYLIHAKAFTAPFQTSTLLSLIFICIFATYLTYLLIPMGLKRIRPTTVSMHNFLQPLITSFFAVFIGQDSFTWEKIGSALFVFGGVYLVTISKSRADELAEKEKLTTHL